MRRVGRWLRDEWSRSDRGLYLVVAVISTLLAVLSLELWRADLRVPLVYWGDALAIGSHFKTVMETGWYESNALLGAPAGQVYHDFPTADNLNFVAAKVLGWFTTDWALAVNLYFIVGFPLAAITMVYLLRVCGVSKGMTLALAPLFAIAPYHFMRGIGHLFLASYFIVPLSLALVVHVLRGRRIWGWRRTGARWSRPFGRGAGTLAIVALTATAQTYYAIFFLVLLAFAGVASFLGRRRLRRFIGAAVAGVLTAAGMLLNMLPDMLYAWIHGPNPTGLERGHAEAETFALKLAQLLLPWPGHRIGFLADIRHQYDESYPNPSEYPALGAIAAIGLVILFLVLAYAATRLGARRVADRRLRARVNLLGGLASLAFVAFIFSTMGGLSTLISFVTTSLRGWNRMSIYIGALGLVAVGIVLDLAIRAIRRRAKMGRVGSAVLASATAAALLVVGFVDQTPADAGGAYAATASRFHADQTWFERVEEAAGDGATILQLPYQSFPEDVGPTGILGSEVLVPYLHTHGIAWTGGGIKGRPTAEWTEVLAAQYDPAQIAAIAAVAGMDGIHVDRASMFPGPRAELEHGLEAELGAPLESADGRFAYYGLGPMIARLASLPAAERDAVAARATNPVTIDDRRDFTRGFDEEGAVESRQRDSDATLRIINDSDREVAGRLELSFRFDPAAGTVPEALEVTLPDGRTERVSIVDGTGRLATDLTARPGASTVTILGSDASAPGSAPLILGARGFRDDVVADFAASFASTPG